MTLRQRQVLFATCLAFLCLAPIIEAKTVLRDTYQIPSQTEFNEYQAAISANPKDYIAHTKLGNWYLHAGRLKASMGEYKKAIKLNARFATAWNNLGSAYHARKDFKNAVKHYRRAIELEPGIAAFHRNLGTALLALSRFGECYAAFRHALELNPTILDIGSNISVATPTANALTHYYFMAKICAEAGRVDAAIEFLEKARAAGFIDFKKVRRDPDFKSVVADARFKRLASELGIP
jgi:tetratricopeptide (TPR) repeat protein